MPISIEVEFSPAAEVYHSGQLLAGNVRLVVERPKRLRAICVYVTGSGRVSWTSYCAIADKIETIEHSGNEEYINCRTCAYNAASGSFFELPAGMNVYSFKYTLPMWLPSSFEGTHGYIRYAVDVVLERPWKFDKTFKKPFAVSRTLDLSRDPSLKLPAQMEYRKQFVLSSTARGILAITVNVLKTGYVSGGVIPIEAIVANNCAYSINKIAFALRKIITYKCTYPAKAEKDEVTTIREKFVDCLVENEQSSFLERLEIPETPPTTLHFCNVLNIAYEARVMAVIPGITANPSVAIPIIIGTAPFESNQPSSPAQSVQYHEEEATSEIDDAPPPSYESVYGSASNY
ncbi:arrestin domain-containing protein 2-like [Phlebotomus argentipes]|uniref:arrestin domain-containing protein 2-like n=1 Tax=Phlebotomus argentipes TaxID=94469 RepID=UPI0028935187|nr:arrestin domain-containing protein 2-like [Phlebotomus argentipes]